MSLEIEGLFKSFTQGSDKINVLSDLRATIQPGEIVAIVGPSGSGKSTLLSLLSGLDRCDSGKININGVDLTRLSERELAQFRAKNISIVFQQFHLMSHLTALENVQLPLEILGQQNTTETAMTFLREVGLEGRAKHLPAQLSGGECQRVAIARALAVRPKLLLADEPSGSLDLQTGDKILKLLFECIRKHKTTTLFVTHSEELAKQCDRTLVLKAGHLEVL